MVVMTKADEQLLAIQRTRSHAAAVLTGLLDAKVQCEATLSHEKRSDMFKAVAGQSSLEAAIAETRRLIDTLDRQIQSAAANLDEADADLLGDGGLGAVVTAGRLSIGGRLGADAGFRGVGARAVG